MIIIVVVSQVLIIFIFALTLHLLTVHNMPGFPILGIEWQKMENPDLRTSMGMKPDQKGVRIRRIDPTALESQVLKPSDILLSFDEVNIANDGTGMCYSHGPVTYIDMCYVYISYICNSFLAKNSDKLLSLWLFLLLYVYSMIFLLRCHNSVDK